MVPNLFRRESFDFLWFKSHLFIGRGFFTGLLFIGLSGPACQESKAGRVLKADQAGMARDLILSNRCGSCHTLKADQLDLKGTVGPDLTFQGRRSRDSKWLQKQLINPASIPDQEVTTGFQGKQKWMPRFDHLSQEELVSIIEFLRSLN